MQLVQDGPAALFTFGVQNVPKNRNRIPSSKVDPQHVAGNSVEAAIQPKPGHHRSRDFQHFGIIDGSNTGRRKGLSCGDPPHARTSRYVQDLCSFDFPAGGKMRCQSLRRRKIKRHEILNEILEKCRTFSFSIHRTCGTSGSYHLLKLEEFRDEVSCQMAYESAVKRRLSAHEKG